MKTQECGCCGRAVSQVECDELAQVWMYEHGGAFVLYCCSLSCYATLQFGGNMDALNVILKSRRDSVTKLKAQLVELDKVIDGASVTVRAVFETERKVKLSRLARLEKEVGLLEAELERLNPSLPGMKPPKK